MESAIADARQRISKIDAELNQWLADSKIADYVKWASNPGSPINVIDSRPQTNNPESPATIAALILSHSDSPAAALVRSKQELQKHLSRLESLADSYPRPEPEVITPSRPASCPIGPARPTPEAWASQEHERTKARFAAFTAQDWIDYRASEAKAIEEVQQKNRPAESGGAERDDMAYTAVQEPA